MIQQEKCYVGTCDNCGNVFDDGEFTLFPEENTVKERMADSEWYMGVVDPDHQGKHYCTNCYELHPEIDDKIIVRIEFKPYQP